MQLDELQLKCVETDLQLGNILYHTLGLASEAGEVAGKVKKVLRDHGSTWDGIQREAIAMELGDVLWYVSESATALGYTLQEIADLLIEKLDSRRKRGVIQGSGDNR